MVQEGFIGVRRGGAARLPGALALRRSFGSWPRHHPSELSGIQASSIETWPAVGGGLLLGMTIPTLLGPILPRRSAKNLFLRIDTQGVATLIVPYVRLEPAVALCATDLVAVELGMPAARVTIDNRLNRRDMTDVHFVADLCPGCELSIKLLAALARTLLTSAAARNWRVATDKCAAEGGRVYRAKSRRSAAYADLAGDAALLPLPDTVVLASGRHLSLGEHEGP